MDNNPVKSVVRSETPTHFLYTATLKHTFEKTWHCMQNKSTNVVECSIDISHESFGNGGLSGGHWSDGSVSYSSGNLYLDPSNFKYVLAVYNSQALMKE